MKTQKNVVVIGLRGAGKSSLIKMLCPKADVSISNGAASCTEKAQGYSLSNLQCQVHDTPGLTEETEMPWFARFILRKTPQTSSEAKKVEKYLKHVKADEGGIHLLIYCMSEQSRMKKSLHTKNYEKFKDVVGKGVPVVVVVTGLDICHTVSRENCQWWSDHGGNQFGMDASVGHACITAQPPDSNNRDSPSYARQKDFYDNSCRHIKSLVRHYYNRL